MGGSGSRLGSKVPKQFLEIEGRPIYQYILELYNKYISLDAIIIVNNKKWNDHLYYQLKAIKEKIGVCLYVVNGGETRSESIKNAILFVNDKFSPRNDCRILIHDATHPYLDIAATNKVLSILSKGTKASTVVTHIWDTVYMCQGTEVAETLAREKIGVGASPEGFIWSFLKEIFLGANSEIANYTSVVNFANAKGIKTEIVWSPIINLKITFPDDLKIFKLSTNYFLKSGE